MPLRLSLWLRRLVTCLIAIMPAVIVPLLQAASDAKLMMEAAFVDRPLPTPFVA